MGVVIKSPEGQVLTAESRIALTRKTPQGQRRKFLLVISAFSTIIICIFAFIVSYSLQKPEIVSHSEEIYWGNLDSSRKSHVKSIYGNQSTFAT